MVILILIIFSILFQGFLFDIIKARFLSNSYWPVTSFFAQIYEKVHDELISRFFSNQIGAFSLHSFISFLAILSSILIVYKIYKNQIQHKNSYLFLLIICLSSIFYLTTGGFLGMNPRDEVDRFALYSFFPLVIFIPAIFKHKNNLGLTKLLPLIVLIIFVTIFPNTIKIQIKRDPIFYNENIFNVINYLNTIRNPINIYTDDYTARAIYINSDNSNLNFINPQPALGPHKNYERVRIIAKDLQNIDLSDIKKYQLNYIILSSNFDRKRFKRINTYSNNSFNSGDYKIIQLTNDSEP